VRTDPGELELIVGAGVGLVHVPTIAWST
jgi:hypothetical protein